MKQRRSSGHPGVGSWDTHEKLRLHQTSRVGTDFLRARARIVVAVAILFITLLWWGPFPTTQALAITCGLSLVSCAFTCESWYARTHTFSARYIAASLLATSLALGLMSFLTGALSSPMLPILFAPVVTGFAAFGDTRVSRAMVLLTVAILIALSFVPDGVPFPPFPPRYHAALHGSALLTGVALLYASVTGLTEGYREVGASLDAMRRDVYEESRERARSLEAVGARVAHELKNPLASIKGLVQLEARAASTPKQQRRFDVLESEILRMEGILSDYLTFSRPLQEPNPQPLTTTQVLGDLQALLATRTEEQGIILHIQDDSALFHADPRLLRQALLNLCANALEASTRGDHIHLRGLQRPHGGVIFEIQDTGEGMDKPTLQNWGTAFETTRASGTGLGVVITRGIVEQHGGTLEVESEPGQGTLVRLTLGALPGGM